MSSGSVAASGFIISLDNSKMLFEQLIADDYLHNQLDHVAKVLLATLANEGTIFTIGNGGSMSEATHFSEELVGKFGGPRRPLASIALSDPAALTCIANDFGFEHVFSRQVEALAKPDDTLLVFSTSGESENLVQAAIAAQAKGVTVLGILGNLGGRVKDQCDYSVVVGGKPDLLDSSTIQLVHLIIVHTIVDWLETTLCGAEVKP